MKEKLQSCGNVWKRARARRDWNFAAPSEALRRDKLPTKRPFVDRSLTTWIRSSVAKENVELSGLCRRDETGGYD